MINAEGRIVAKPLRVDHPFPAGQSSCKNPDIFRSGLVISSAPLLKSAPGDHWNLETCRSFSTCPDPLVGLPFDSTKPRKGFRGEILGTTISRDSFEVEQFWSDFHSGANYHMREGVAAADVRRDLQKRIEICLYGKPRDYSVLTDCDSLRRYPRDTEQRLKAQYGQPAINNSYSFRYDDGFSASFGARKCPLIFYSSDMRSILAPDLYGIDRPPRELPSKPVNWWPEVQVPVCERKRPEARPRYFGLHYDYTRAPPTEYELRHF